MSTQGGGAAAAATAPAKKGVWKMAMDQKRNKPYYYHTVTKEVRWTKPPDEEMAPQSLAVKAAAGDTTPDAATPGATPGESKKKPVNAAANLSSTSSGKAAAAAKPPAAASGAKRPTTPSGANKSAAARAASAAGAKTQEGRGVTAPRGRAVQPRAAVESSRSAPVEEDDNDGDETSHSASGGPQRSATASRDGVTQDGASSENGDEPGAESETRGALSTAGSADVGDSQADEPPPREEEPERHVRAPSDRGSEVGDTASQSVPGRQAPPGTAADGKDEADVLAKDEDRGAFEEDESDEEFGARAAVAESKSAATNGTPGGAMEIDLFEEALRLLPKTTEESLLLKRLDLLDINDPSKDPRVPPAVNRHKGVFYQLIRILNKYPNSVALVEKTMHLLKRFGSVEAYVIPAIENDIVSRTVGVILLHMEHRKIVGDAVILLGNLALNEYVKELIRMEEGVKVLSKVMTHDQHVEDPVLLDKCCYCLANVAVENVDNIRDIVQMGALKAVITAVDKFKNHPTLIDSGTVVLSNLCAGGDAYRLPIAEEGAVKALVSIMLLMPDNLQLLNDCLKALGNLALAKETIPILISDGAVAALVRTIQSHRKHAALAALTVSVLGNIAAFCSAEQVAALVDLGAMSAVVDASLSHPKAPEVHHAVFSAIANFAKTVQQPGSKVDKAVMQGVKQVVDVLMTMQDDESVVSKALKLLTLVSQQEQRAKRLVNMDVHKMLSSLLREFVRKTNLKMQRDILALAAALSSEVTAPSLASGDLVEMINLVVSEMVDDVKTLEAAIKALRRLATHQASAQKVAEVTVRSVVRAAKRHRDKPALVEKLAPLFGELAIFQGTMKHIMDHEGGTLLVELLEEHTRSPDIATALITALTNMMMSDDDFAHLLKKAHTDRLVRPTLELNANHAQLRNAATLFLQKLEQVPEEREEKQSKRYEELDVNQQHLLLKEKFNVPQCDQAALNFLTAGQVLRVHSSSGRPTMRHVAVAEHAKFITLRDPDKPKEDLSLPLRKVTEVVPGAVTRELQRTYILGKPANPEHSFAVLAEDFALSLEASSKEQREQWVAAMREVVKYRRALAERRRDLTEEEEKKYF